MIKLKEEIKFRLWEDLNKKEQNTHFFKGKEYVEHSQV